MPAQTQKSNLFAKLGSRINKAAAAAMEKPVQYGNARLPGGITNGVAKLTGVVVDEAKTGNNKGQPYIRFAAVVVSPKSVVVNGDDVPVEGLQTSVLEMLCDTKTQAGKETSFDEHADNACNELRKLGGPDFDVSDFEGAVKSLNEAAQDPDAPIYFRFSTQWRNDQATGKPKYDDNPWENWYGTKGLEDYVPPDAAAAQTQDESGPAAPPARTVPPKTSANGKPATAPVNRVANKPAPTPQPDPNPDGAADEPDIDDLLAKSEVGNGEAQAEMTRLAIEAGSSPEAVEAAPDWAAVAAMARGEAPADEATSPEQDAANPAVGNVFYFKPPKVKKAIECEVKKVNTKVKTCVLLNLTDGKTEYKDVLFTALENGQ